jgi:hypothetical protein
MHTEHVVNKTSIHAEHAEKTSMHAEHALKTFRRMHSRGLQFYTFFKISLGIKRRMIDTGKKITFNFLKNV